MIFYYDNTGKLVTITAHGEIPRQGGGLNLYVLLNKDFNSVPDANTDGMFDGCGIKRRMIKARFKTQDSFIFSEDYIMENLGLQKFTKLPGENIGGLIDGNEYYTFMVDISDTYALTNAGKLELAFTLMKYSEITDEDTSETISVMNEWGKTLQLGKAIIYIEEALGLYPSSGIGMTFSEYTSLMGTLNKLVDDVTVNRIGILRASDYDSDTGEISLIYDEDIVENMDYEESTGILIVSW